MCSPGGEEAWDGPEEKTSFVGQLVPQTICKILYIVSLPSNRVGEDTAHPSFKLL